MFILVTVTLPSSPRTRSTGNNYRHHLWEWGGAAAGGGVNCVLILCSVFHMRDFIESFQNFDVVDLIIIQPISQNVLLETVKEGI